MFLWKAIQLIMPEIFLKFEEKNKQCKAAANSIQKTYEKNDNCNRNLFQYM